MLIEAAALAAEDDVAGQVDRIVDQWGENFHRAGITEAEEAAAQQQLLDLGLTAAQVARRTHTPAKRVRALHAVNGSEVASAALRGIGGPALLLDQAAVVAEFDDGREDSAAAVERLLEVAETDPDRFGHVTQRLRDARAERAILTEHAQHLREQGVQVLSDETAAEATELYELRPTADDAPGTPLAVEGHLDCPGHAVHLSLQWDWQAGSKVVHTAAYCTQPDRHAPRLDVPSWSSATPTGSPAAGPAGGEGAGSGDQAVDEEQLKQRQRAERRRVIANNKAWESATSHRRQWLTEFLARKKAPANAAVFIATTLAGGAHDARRAMEGGHVTTCALLKLPEPKPYWSGGASELVEAARAATGARATQLTLAVLLGAYEEGTSRDSWRHPTAETRAYFTALRDWKYPLSDVEQLVLDPTADQTVDTGAATSADSTDDSTDDDADGDEDVEEPAEVSEPAEVETAGGEEVVGWPASA